MPGFPDDLARAVFIKLREFGTRAFPLHVSLYQEPLFSLTPMHGRLALVLINMNVKSV